MWHGTADFLRVCGGGGGGGGLAPGTRHSIIIDVERVLADTTVGSSNGNGSEF